MSITFGVLMQIAVSVQVADTIPARTAVPLIVRATINGNTAPQMTQPVTNGATLQLVSDVTRLGGGFGQAVATRETRYLLRASAPGMLVLPPVVATVGTQQAVSPVKRIVVQAPPTNAVPALVTRAPVSRSTAVNFHSLVTPDTVWAGEQVTLQVGVFIDDELRSRLQRNPEYVAPSVDGAVAYELPVNNDALPSRDVQGARYRPFVFARALFPIRAGVLTIPPARLSYTLGSAGTMFGRQERQTSSTPTRTVMVRELPVDGRPVGFAGAVGVYGITATVERGAGRVGDALQLSVTVQGAGNVKLLPPPQLSIPGVGIDPAGESITIDSTDLLVRGSKTFRFLLTPKRDGEVPLGDVQYAYFNPVRGVYEVASAPLGALRVAAGTAIADDEQSGARIEPLPLQGWSVETVDDVTETWWFRALFVALGAPWLALIVRRFLRWLPRRPSRERRLRSRDVHETGDLTAGSVRRTFIRSLAPLVQLRSDQPFVVDDVIRRLRRAGASGDAAEAAGALLRRLDLLTFGREEVPSRDVLPSLQREADAVQQQLSAEMSTKVRERLKASVRSVLLVLGAGSMLQAQPPAFREGVARYRAQRFSDAAVSFAEAAATAPTSAAAWADLGAAHWMRADTAGAIV
ncbi:MAG TPA: BatD family protein, partial [Gemmatimonadaceae bacterium]|nr:BatD family protein [Gemmatimonadaceae bacterium]